MVEKTYEQMQTEYIEFCNKFIKPYISKYEKMSKDILPIQISFLVMLLTLPEALVIYFVYHETELALILFIPFIFALIWFICFFVNNTINFGLFNVFFSIEKELKNKFMKPVLDIFSTNCKWKKGIKHNYFKKIREYKKSNIFNFFIWLIFDDVMYIEHNDIKISIYETDASIFSITAMLYIGVILSILSIILPFIDISYGHIVFGCPLVIAPLFVFGHIFDRMALIEEYHSFIGIVVEIDMNKNFAGHTLFHEKSKCSEQIYINKRKYEFVNLESIDFMEKYNVFSTDQIEARYLLTPSMIERLNNLKLDFDANYIRGSFKDNKLILAIDTGKDMFSMGNNFKEADSKTFINFFNEITSIMKIIDQLKLNEKTGL